MTPHDWDAVRGKGRCGSLVEVANEDVALMHQGGVLALSRWPSGGWKRGISAKRERIRGSIEEQQTYWHSLNISKDYCVGFGA